MKRTFLAVFVVLLAGLSMAGTAAAGDNGGPCYTVEVDHPDGGEPMTTTVCP